MKRILAFVLALMLLSVTAASAEIVISIVDPVVKINNGEEQTIDLTGFAMVITAEQQDGMSLAQMDIMSGEDKLASMSFNAVGDKLLFAFGDAVTVYSVDMPAGTPVGGAGVDISSLNIDVDALMDKVMSEVEVDGDTIRVPYTALNDLLEELVPALEGVEIPGVDVAQFADTVAQMKQDDSGVNLELTYSQSETGFSGAATLTPVEKGAPKDEAITATIDTQGSDLDFRLDAPGQGSFYLSVQSEEAIAHVSLGGEASGASADMSFDVTMQEAEAELRVLDAAGALDVQNLTEEQSQAMLFEAMGAAGGLMSLFGGMMDGDTAA